MKTVGVVQLGAVGGFTPRWKGTHLNELDQLFNDC
jgi:hypothetical protein